MIDFYLFCCFYRKSVVISTNLIPKVFQSAGAVEYTDCTSTEGVRPPPATIDTKQSDGEVPVMMELWGKRSTPSLPSLPGPLWSRVVATDKGPIYGLNRTKPNCLN